MIPDIRSLSREFLLSVLFFGARDKHLTLYEKYKDIEFQKSTTCNKKYIAKISEEMMGHLKNFQSIFISKFMNIIYLNIFYI